MCYHDIMKEHMDRFPARIPPDLKRALAERAEALGTSMNDLVIQGVRSVVAGAEIVVTPSAVDDAHEDLVALAIEGEIGPLKGIAGHYVETGHHNLGALLYWVAARMQEDHRFAASELVRSADRVRRRSPRIAKAMLQASLSLNPANDVAKSRLGQLLYFEGDYKGAVDLLERVREDDNYAKLSYGWASLELANTDEDAAIARDEIVVSLRRWALGQRSPESRDRWLGQVARLRARGPVFEQSADDLIDYANDNAAWPAVNAEDVARANRRSSGRLDEV